MLLGRRAKKAIVIKDVADVVGRTVDAAGPKKATIIGQQIRHHLQKGPMHVVFKDVGDGLACLSAVCAATPFCT